jgi:CheY-like chemotaxis protein
MANITIVDDDFAIEILAENLRYFGHEVSRLANAQEALSNLDELLESDMLILDIIMECPTDMPEAKISGGRTTGMTIFQRVREKRTDIPILASLLHQTATLLMPYDVTHTHDSYRSGQLPVLRKFLRL